MQDRYGASDVLELREVERPTPGASNVLVRVAAAAVDQGVWHLMTGKPYLTRLFGFGLRAPKQPIRGLDLAGVVASVGEGVTRFAPGDEVFGTCEGAFAEYAVTSEDALVAKPSHVSFADAAAIPNSGFAALQGLRDAGGVRAGQSVLVLGAGGGVGALAVQLAVTLGAEVTGVCSTGKVELVRSLGAAHVVDYTREDVTDGSRRWDLILDTGGNRPLSTLRRALTPTGTLVIVGAETGGSILGGTDRQLRAMLLSPFLRQRLRGLMSSGNRADLETLAHMLAVGTMRGVVDRSYPLTEAASAVDRVRSGASIGKVVLTIG